MRRVRHLLAVCSLLLMSFASAGCHHHAPHYGPTWPSPYDACVQDPPPSFTASDELMTRKEMRELKRWYRQLHHQQKHARHHAHHASPYDTWGTQGWSEDVCPCEVDGYAGLPTEAYPASGFVGGIGEPWEVTDPGWQPVGEPCHECESSVVVPPPQHGTPGTPAPPAEPRGTTPDNSKGEPTISPAPAESTPPADPAPAEPQPMAREIEPVSEYLTPPATLPTSVSTGAGALKPTLWVPTAPTN